MMEMLYLHFNVLCSFDPVTHVSRPMGSRYCGQVTCSRWGCSAHSWLQWCDAEKDEFPLLMIVMRTIA